MNYLYIIILFAAKNVDCKNRLSSPTDSIFKGLMCRYEAKTTVPLPENVAEIEKKDCIDSADYLKVSEMPYYVDKTEFISKIMKDSSNFMEFCAPRRFSKSTFLSMMRSFLSIETNENGVVVNPTPEKRFESTMMKSFKNKAVFRDKLGNEASSYDAMKTNDLFNLHFQNHPVIKADFSMIAATSYRFAYRKLHNVIAQACLQHKYIFKNQSLWSSVSDARRFENKYCKFHENHNTVMEDDITEAFWRLSEKLYQHFGKKVIVLIDEIDAPTTSAIYNENFSELDVRNVDQIMKSLLASMCKQTDFDYIEKVIVTSILSLNAAMSQEPVNMKHYRFSQNKKYDLLFGFTGQDVEKMIKSNVNLLEDRYDNFDVETFIKNTAIWFDGYETTNSVSIYNPWSVLNTITSGIFSRYWAKSPNQKKMLGLCIHPKILPTMWLLLAGDTVEMEMEDGVIENINTDGLIILREILLHSKVSNPSPFFKYLCETGYLSCKISNNYKMIMNIPNYEISLQLHQQIFYYQEAQQSYTIPSYLMSYIGKTFTRIAATIVNGASNDQVSNMQVAIPNDGSYYEQIDPETSSSVKGLVQQLASNLHSLHEVIWSRFENIGWGTIRDLDLHLVEHNFKWALCVILKHYFPTFEDGAQEVLKEEPVKSGKGRIDIVVTTHGVTFIIELKYGGNSTVALMQCIDNDYLSILPSAPETSNKHPYMILGINFRKNKKKTVDISYLHNSNDQNNIQTVSV